MGLDGPPKQEAAVAARTIKNQNDTLMAGEERDLGTIFEYSGTDLSELRRTYAKLVRDEFYDGELDTGDSSCPIVTVEKGLADPISLMRVTSNVGISYRRAWPHIRSNKTGIRVIWFVRRGALRVVRAGVASNVVAGECTIVDSGVPFHAHAFPDADGAFEAAQALVPAHLFLSHLSNAVEFDKPFAMKASSCQFIGKLLDLMFREGDHLSRNTADPLASAFLEAIADEIRGLAIGVTSRRRLVEKRLEDIDAYITKNLTNPDLSYEEVAAKCGISPRYLCYVLKANNTSFSHLLWSRRLPKAQEWLISPALRCCPINEIAYMAGFKSAAHFSRMFKTTYGCSPKNYRNRADRPPAR